MRLAVLGANEQVPALIEALGEEHACELLIECGRWRPALQRLAPQAADASWETLLDGVADGVIAAIEPQAEAEQREHFSDQLRKLAGAGVAMLIVVPCCEAIVGYELDMIRRDTEAVLFPYSPLACHAGAERVAEQLARPPDEIGEVQQLVLERQVPPLDDQQRQFALGQDAHLLEGLLGGLAEFSASSSSPGTLENLSAHFRGGQLVARWSLVPGVDHGLRLTIVGANGRAAWVTDPSGSTWSCGEQQEALPCDAPRRALALFAAECQGQETSRWEGACRAAEVADNALRSADRGRSVAMQEQTPTEEDTFKGMMAAGSCGLLMLTLLILLVGGVIESVRFPAARNKMVAERAERQRDGQAEPAPAAGRSLWLRWWPVYPLMAFLLLQLLRLVFPAETPPPERDEME